MSATFSAREAKEQFGNMVAEARREPVTITNHNRPVVVVMSVERYNHLEAIEDFIWSERAKAAAEEGYATDEEVKALFARLLDGNP